VLNGHSGRGIVLSTSDNGHPLVNAPLYVKYKKKRKEFRVHVFQGAIIDVAEKRRMRAERRPDIFDGYIRNHANGWVFCRNSVVRPADLEGSALAACAALGLDFGAVDIIWNERENKSYVLEVNTAPGLMGTTLTNYANAILGWVRRQA
jgi:glutathione synthase/RimK-type ligase-like ATP-grasp enzyme